MNPMRRAAWLLLGVCLAAPAWSDDAPVTVLAPQSVVALRSPLSFPYRKAYDVVTRLQSATQGKVDLIVQAPGQHPVNGGSRLLVPADAHYDDASSFF